MVETADGSTGNVAVAKEGSGTEVTIPAGAEATVDLTDTYESGALVVNKTITGSAAGSQGEVRIAVSCDEAGAQTSQPDFVIPAGTPAGTVSMSYPNILAGSTCALTETATGATETATAMTVGTPQDVTISENGTATANVVNTYDYVPGALVVTKDIAGPAAGQQGQVSIGVSCVLGGAQTTLDPFVIPAGQPAGIVSHTYEGIPAGSTCTVAETQNGSTSTVSVADRRRQPDSCRPGPGRSRSQYHRHLLSGHPGPRCAHRHQDDHRAGCWSAGRDHHRGQLQWDRPTGLRHPGRNSCEYRFAQLRRHRRRFDLHRDRNGQWCLCHGARRNRGEPADGRHLGQRHGRRQHH